MKIVIGNIVGTKRPIGFDLATLIPTRLLIQANSGAGKSYLLRKLMEELFGHIQVIAIDPEGEFATLREKFGYVLVGKGGETPADVRTAATVAEKLLELHASAVCDLYEMPARERHAWVREFLGALINAPKKLWHPVVIIVDESHLFCPEEGDSEAADAMIDLATRGRKRGFCPVWATQRLAKLDKDAAAELQNKLIGGTFLDVDIKRAANDLGLPTSGKEFREFAAHIKVMEPGTFIALGRAISKNRVELKVASVHTSHPKSGSAKHAAEPPPPPEKVRELLPKLADLPKVAEEKARTVADFKRQVHELQTKLRDAERRTIQAKPVVTEVKVSDPKLQRRYASLKSCMEDAMKIIAQVTAKEFEDLAIKPEELKAAFDQVAVQIGKLAEKKLQQRNADIDMLKKQFTALQRKLSMLVQGDDAEIKVDPAIQHNKPFTVAATSPRAPRTAANGAGNAVKLPPGERAVLIASVQYSEGVGRDQLSVLTGYKRSSRDTYIQRLRDKGYVEQRGDSLVATDTGIAALGDGYEPLPIGKELREYWMRRLPPGEKKILAELVRSYPNDTSRDSLDQLGFARSSRDTYLQRLGSRRLITVSGRDVRASETLF